MFPNPWHLGHAPIGLLKLNRLGSGAIAVSRRLAGESLAEMEYLRVRHTGLLEIDFAGLPVADFHRVHQALVQAGRIDDAVHQRIDGFEKSMSSSDSGVENSNIRPPWNRRLNPFFRNSNK